VARALAVRPRLLLADQATTDLDAANRTRVMALIRELAAAGSAVLLASDDPAVIEASDRIVVLREDR
jgi:putative ABC transport system ATP-binding protein